MEMENSLNELQERDDDMDDQENVQASYLNRSLGISQTINSNVDYMNNSIDIG